MHSSWFSYLISRPYPFRWFIPVTIAGGVVLAVVFTLINLGSSGFYLKSEFTSDPNGTISGQAQWFMKPPFSWEHNLEPKCEAKMLSVGDSFFTSAHGFQYTVKSLERVNDGDTKSVETFPSIPYLNNTLEDCFLDRVSLKLKKPDAIGSPTWWISWSAASSVDASAACSVMAQLGRVNISLALQYTGTTDHLYGYILEDNPQTNASIWWGTRLLNAYLSGVWEIMSLTQRVGENDDHYWAFGNIPYFRDPSERDIRSLKFFRSDAWIASSHGRMENTSMVVVGSRLGFANGFTETKNFTYLFENSKHPLSPVATEGLHYAKILHSLVSIDLGNCQAPNLLLNDDDLKYAIDAPESPNRKPGKNLDYLKGEYHSRKDRYNKIPRPNTLYNKNLTFLHEAYDEFRNLTGKLSCQNSTIVAQYLCSVPESKSTGTMILAIVIANLVFLQAAWRLLSLMAQWMLLNVDPQAMVCEGCLKGSYAMEEVSSRPISRRSDTDSRGESTAQLIQ